MEQLDLFTSIPTEEWVYSVLQSNLADIVVQNNVALEKLNFKEGNSYSSVWYDTQMAFRICCRGNHHYFGVSNAYVSCASPEISSYITKDGRSDGFINFEFTPTYDGVLQYSTFLASVLDTAIDAIPKEFDCCSRFEECSNARNCVNPSPDLAIACGYRKILKSGRIFYGKNRNAT